MFRKPLLKAAVAAAILGLSGLMLATMTGCSSKSSSPSTSQNQAASPAVSPSKKTPLTGSPEKGKELFSDDCTTCHGMQGQGVPHLGADLQTSRFVAASSDAQLVAFIEQGRAASDPMNKMHVAMPPKGGNPALTTQDLDDIVAFLRQTQKTRAKR
ncbi:MAG TPA: cytochrome c [Terriglobia bacterium]|nr:cytochrome c [Terriglobia bacterium]